MCQERELVATLEVHHMLPSTVTHICPPRKTTSLAFIVVVSFLHLLKVLSVKYKHYSLVFLFFCVDMCFESPLIHKLCLHFFLLPPLQFIWPSNQMVVLLSFRYNQMQQAGFAVASEFVRKPNS